MSILITLPTFNRPEEIKYVIDDIVKQKYTTWTLLIINDGSSKDNITKYNEFISSLSNNNIIYIENEKNMKLPKTLNIWIKYFLDNDFDYFTWISDDNRYYTNYLETIVNELDKKYDFVYTKFDYTRPHRNNKIYSTNYEYKNYNDLLNKFFGLGAFGWSRNIIKEIGYFNEELFLLEDYDYYIRTFYKTKNIKFCNETTMKIILSKTNLTATYKPKIKNLSSIVKNIYQLILNVKYEDIVFEDIEKHYVKNNVLFYNRKYGDIINSITKNINYFKWDASKYSILHLFISSSFILFLLIW